MTNLTGLCNCGKGIRYSRFDVGGELTSSCNKYNVCPTYETLREERDNLNNELYKIKVELKKYKDILITAAFMKLGESDE